MKVLLIAIALVAFGCGPMIGNISPKQALALYSAKTSENEQTLQIAAAIIEDRCRVAMELADGRGKALEEIKYCAQMMEKLAERSAEIQKQPAKYTEGETLAMGLLDIFANGASKNNLDLNVRFEELTQNLRRWTTPYNITAACLETSRSDDELAQCLKKVMHASFMQPPTELENVYSAGLRVVFHCASRVKAFDQYKDKNEYVNLMTRCIVLTRKAITVSSDLTTRYRNPIYQNSFREFSKIFYLALIYFGTSAECASEGAKDGTALFACMDKKINNLRKEHGITEEPKK